MYRILIADDEGIMVESLKMIILRNFDSCTVETAKTGREAIEKAEYTHPDIIFMDIQMPGINGIQALKEIRRFNQTALVYVISAYDKFDYAKEAIALGAEQYLMKPVAKKVVIDTVQKAIDRVDEMRRQRSDRLRVQEKLETVIPVVENGLISNMLIKSDWQDAGHFRQLLELTEEYGFVMIFRFGTTDREKGMVTPVGVSVQAQDFYSEFRAIVKSFLHCIIGGIISDHIVVVVPREKEELTYEERVQGIEDARAIVSRLEQKLDVSFRVGIGRVHRLEEMRSSYLEAGRALNESDSHVVHTNDIVSHGVYEGGFPGDLEKEMFLQLSRGDVEGMQRSANGFFDWMLQQKNAGKDTLRLKILEFVLVAEKNGFDEGAVNYRFESRRDYLSEIMGLSYSEDLREWFLAHMTDICRQIRDQKNTQSENAVTKAKAYIQENFDHEISLDDVSKEVNISPYYFSKLFKEESGENFIEYLTRIRMERARQLLLDPSYTVKEISSMTGYADPNYFSRIFKKQTGMTPREFRESV